jgi:MFS family permease
LICGPLSDATGRKKVLYGGILLFLAGTVLCYGATDIQTLLLGRFIQGLGVSGPYVSAISIVRDKYAGNDMARIMSLVMMIFIMVPALAPSLGLAVMWIGDWRDIFVLYVFYALMIGVWIFFRLEETLPQQNRIALSTKGFAVGFREVISNVPTVCYMICMGLFFGSFIGYLNSSQQIFQEMFQTGDLFSLYFGLLAIVFGISSLVNSQLVQKLGMHYLAKLAIWGIILSSALFLVVHLNLNITLWIFMCYAAVLFFCFGLVFGNVNAMAMEPMGHVAGIAAGSGFTTPNRQYRGVAPEAELVFVSIKYSNDTLRGSALGDYVIANPSIIDAYKYIFDYAASVGKPAVINLSWGMHTGPHDGTSLFDIATEQLVGNGKIIVGANGNDGENPMHLNYKFNKDTISTLAIENNRQWRGRESIYCDFWGSKNSRFGIQVQLLDTHLQIVRETPFVYSNEINRSYTLSHQNNQFKISFQNQLIQKSNYFVFSIISDFAHFQHKKIYLFEI